MRCMRWGCGQERAGGLCLVHLSSKDNTFFKIIVFVEAGVQPNWWLCVFLCVEAGVLFEPGWVVVCLHLKSLHYIYNGSVHYQKYIGGLGTSCTF